MLRTETENTEKDDTWQNWRDFEDGGIGAIDAFWETQGVFKRDKSAWTHGNIRCKNCCKDRTVSGTLFKSEKSLKDHQVVQEQGRKDW